MDKTSGRGDQGSFSCDRGHSARVVSRTRYPQAQSGDVSLSTSSVSNSFQFCDLSDGAAGCGGGVWQGEEADPAGTLSVSCYLCGCWFGRNVIYDKLQF